MHGFQMCSVMTRLSYLSSYWRHLKQSGFPHAGERDSGSLLAMFLPLSSLRKILPRAVHLSLGKHTGEDSRENGRFLSEWKSWDEASNCLLSLRGAGWGSISRWPYTHPCQLGLRTVQEVAGQSLPLASGCAFSSL